MLFNDILAMITGKRVSAGGPEAGVRSWPAELPTCCCEKRETLLSLPCPLPCPTELVQLTKPEDYSFSLWVNFLPFWWAPWEVSWVPGAAEGQLGSCGDAGRGGPGEPPLVAAAAASWQGGLAASWSLPPLTNNRKAANVLWQLPSLCQIFVRD